jgi:L-threonylcarbamoyladenylate synthase
MKAEIGKNIDKAAALLSHNELVAIPTETVYGLAGNALNSIAVSKIFEAKNRPVFDPLIVHISSMHDCDNYVSDFPAVLQKLAAQCWPGPLTLLLPKKDIIPDLVTSGLSRVALRVPAHPLTLALLRQINFPLAAPSANPFGYISPTRPEHVAQQLGDKIAYILDGGFCEVGIESTIVGMEDNNICIYRLGGLSKEDIEALSGQSVQMVLHHQGKVAAPGQLSSHYAPDKKMVLGNIAEWLAHVDPKEVGILSFKDPYDAVEASRQIILSPQGDLREAAQYLFSALRELDAMPVKMILAEAVPDIGLGRAINDRLRRASVNRD